MNFELLGTDGVARRGRLSFPRGKVETPAFMPVGTYGSVKGVLPEQVRALGAENLPRGAHVRLRVGGTDLLTLDVHASVVARLDDAVSAAEATSPDAEGDEGAESIGPLTLAIDVQDRGHAGAAAGRRRSGG